MTEKLKMASIVPGRSDQMRASVFFGHLRYFWELILSRPSAPASSTAAWLIDRHVLLDEIGGFAPHKSDILPEAHIAAILGTASYHCLISDERLGVTYEKKWQSQVETSQRLLFPMMGGTWSGALLGFLVLLLLNLPLITLLSSLVFGWMIAQTMALWVMLAFMALYGVYTSLMWRHGWWIGGLLWPVIILQELVLFVRSVWGYKTGTITWKGRSIAAAPYRVSHIKIDE